MGQLNKKKIKDRRTKKEEKRKQAPIVNMFPKKKETTISGVSRFDLQRQLDDQKKNKIEKTITSSDSSAFPIKTFDIHPIYSQNIYNSFRSQGSINFSCIKNDEFL